MDTAEVRVGAAGAAISPHLFGALVEHFGLGIYGGVWDQERDVARADVTAAVRALGTSMMRYPGGCFSDWYHWRDGVGERAHRPTHDRTFWTDFTLGGTVSEAMARQFGPVETNQFGTDEFLQYCLDVDAEPMLAANFGSGSPEEAADWVRYCNVDQTAPRPVRWWSVGNETYGQWELGHCGPDEYARRFVEFATAMRDVDPTIKLLAVGFPTWSGAPSPEWNHTVLREAGEHADALSVHWYFPGPWMSRSLRDDEADYLQLATAPLELGAMLDGVIASIDDVLPGADFPIALDEWNLWADWEDLLTANRRHCDGVFYAGCYNRMIERSGRVQMAMVSHLVNCMAPVQTRGERHFVTSGYLVGQLYRDSARRYAAPVEINAPEVRAAPFADTGTRALSLTQAPLDTFRPAPAIDVSATTDQGGTTVFLANRRMDAPVAVTVTGLPPGRGGRWRHLDADGPFVTNDVDRPHALRWRDVSQTTDDTGTCTVIVPPHTAGALSILELGGSSPQR